MIKLIVFDIDGVLTDGCFIVDKDGFELKKINFSDLDSFSELKKLDIKTLFLTGEKNSLTGYFNNKFKPDFFIDGANNKEEELENFCKKHHFSFDEVCYVGDGKKDVSCMKKCLISISPCNAINDVKKIASHNLSIKGGNGVVSEVLNIVNNYNNNIFYNDFYNVLKEHEKIIKKINDNFNKNVSDSINLMIRCLKCGNMIYACGNGGSAADAQHLTAELVSKFNYDRKSLSAISLTTNSSIITSIGNDYTFDNIFKRQIEGLGRKNDILFAITTSGSSKNIMLAINEALKKEMKVILLTSEKCILDNKKNLIIIKVPSKETPRIQEIHIMLIHYICEKIENYFLKEYNYEE